MEEVRAWYNGYVFGGEVIYNPWSVLCFLDSEGRTPALLALDQLQRPRPRAAGALRLDLQPVFESLLAGGASSERSTRTWC
jgi:hypothetical protein